jgi:hypothetical protein
VQENERARAIGLSLFPPFSLIRVKELGQEQDQERRKNRKTQGKMGRWKERWVAVEVVDG